MNLLDSKILEKKNKHPFMTYVDFQNILVLEDNGKQNSNESYTNKYQKNVVSSYDYKLICVDDKLNKLFKSYLGNDAVYNFISSIIEESKYCSDIMKNYFNKKFVMIRKDNEHFKNSTNFVSVIMIILMVMLK